jgi:hypothetical protein
MNELPGYLGKGGGGVERGIESDVLNFILHSQASVVIIPCFSRCSICFVLRIYKFITVFLW